MKRILVVIALVVMAQGCSKTDAAFDKMNGILINEVSPCPSIGKEGWIELFNKSDRTIRLKGLRILLTTDSFIEEPVATLQKGEIAAGGFFVVSTEEVEFSEFFLRATFREIAISNADGDSLDSFSTRADLNTTSRPENGGSYARIIDAADEWIITPTATPGASNYHISPHPLSSLVVNEVCPDGKWIELYNTAAFEQNLEYAIIRAPGDVLLCRVPGGVKIPAGGHVALDCEKNVTDFSSFSIYDNSGAQKVVEFSASGLGTPPAGGSWCRLPDGTGDFRTTDSPTKGTVNIVETESLTDHLVINEVSLAGWVEICNFSPEQINAPGLILKAGASIVGTKGPTKIPAGGKVVFDVTVTGNETFSLCAPDGTVLNTFSRNDVRKDSRTADASTSWSRLPDGTGNWYTVFTPSKGEANYGIEEGNTIGIWVLDSHAMTFDMEELCRKGIGHILLHELALKDNGAVLINNICTQAHRLGMKVHFWMQCFWWNDKIKWRVPVIDRDGSTPARYNQELFDEVLDRAEDYMNLDIDGIHFDYIRFGATASWHNWPEDGITSVGAITEFCRQAYSRLKGKNPKIVLSAALIGEIATQDYYGQDPAQMAQYIDILMPMAFVSAYNYSPKTNVNVANWFANRSNDKQCWHGLSTYNYNYEGLSEAELLGDCSNITHSRADGIVLFRYGLGNLPNLTGMFAK